jgi:hypothetical protein
MPSSALEVGPTALPLGTKVGTWRVYGIRGQGSYGTVYRAMPEGHALAGPVALKLAINPGDARFEREVELLSRIRHPSVPRLLDAGLWRSPLGGSHPFVVMAWVEGEPLYAWAARRNPSSRRVLSLLAQAAGALQAIHEVNSVHRDVKGDNMLVRPSDGRLFLTDLGAGDFAGATRLTPPRTVPGTPEYRSPELWQSAILRMLSPRPEERGAAGELAQAMERGVAHAGPPADAPLFEWETLKPMEWTDEELAEAEHLGHRPRRRNRERALEAAQADAAESARVEQREAEVRTPTAGPTKKRALRHKLPWIAAMLALWLGPGETGSLRTGTQPMVARTTSGEEPDAVSLGETALKSSPERAKPSEGEGVTEELPEPLPGQPKPDAKGRCPKKQLAINGGCWFKVTVDLKDCPVIGSVYQGQCYVPVQAAAKVPTSAPQER